MANVEDTGIAMVKIDAQKTDMMRNHILEHEGKLSAQGGTMTTCATVCSEIGVLRFSCKVTDFARYDKENFILSCRVLSFCTKTAKEKVAF